MIEPPSCFTETAKPKSMTRGVFEVTLSEWIGTTVFCVLTEDTSMGAECDSTEQHVRASVSPIHDERIPGWTQTSVVLENAKAIR